MRITHRRCRAENTALTTEAAWLATEVETLTGRNETLADDLRAAEHAMDEVVAACTDIEYATTEAAIPAVLRDRLVEADHLGTVEADLAEAQAGIDQITAERDLLLHQRARILQDAHEQGRLVQVLALTPAYGPLPDTIQTALDRLSTLTWMGGAPWWCPAECGADTRMVAWDSRLPEQAHLSCECGRVWSAPAGAVALIEQELATRKLLGGVRSSPVRWADRPRHELEAIDSALPTPAQLRESELAARRERLLASHPLDINLLEEAF